MLLAGHTCERSQTKADKLRLVPCIRHVCDPVAIEGNGPSSVAANVYPWHKVEGSIGETGRAMGEVDAKIAGLRARVLRAGALHPAMMAALLLAGSSALAQENRGTEQQRVACTPDVLRLCSWEIPNVDRIVACLRREKSQLSVGCRQVLKIEATASRAPLNNGAEPRHAPRHHFGQHRSPAEYERSDTRE
jgi:hypothetical protein